MEMGHRRGGGGMKACRHESRSTRSSQSCVRGVGAPRGIAKYGQQARRTVRLADVTGRGGTGAGQGRAGRRVCGLRGRSDKGTAEHGTERT